MTNGKTAAKNVSFPRTGLCGIGNQALDNKDLICSLLPQGLSLGESTTRITQIHMSLALVKDSVVGAWGADEFGSV